MSFHIDAQQASRISFPFLPGNADSIVAQESTRETIRGFLEERKGTPEEVSTPVSSPDRTGPRSLVDRLLRG